MIAEILLKQLSLFGIELINTKDFLELIIRFSFNLIITVVIAKYLYYTITKRKDYLFSYIIIGTMTFLICFLLSNVKLQMGFALGLFAVFGIIRYRTNQIRIKEMSYLFLIIGVSVINALANKKVSYAELIFTNAAAIGITYFLEYVWLLKNETSKTIIYENIKLIKPNKRNLLIQDLEKRTGLIISRIEIGRIDFLRDTARIKIFFFQSEQKDWNVFDEEDYNQNITDDD
ncbi:MAG: DUF4956 domain-containing protein [Bacteroidetes bacterium]|nr:MAG: DUF4956 domain-containing protein [Bacteroidota bacterium]